jgi:hypothetical protein
MSVAQADVIKDEACRADREDRSQFPIVRHRTECANKTAAIVRRNQEKRDGDEKRDLCQEKELDDAQLLSGGRRQWRLGCNENRGRKRKGAAKSARRHLFVHAVSTRERPFCSPFREQGGIRAAKRARGPFRRQPSNRLFFGKPLGGRRPASARLPIHSLSSGLPTVNVRPAESRHVSPSAMAKTRASEMPPSL